MNKSSAIEQLMGYGLAEVHAVEIFHSRSKSELLTILDFLCHYGEYIAT